MTPAGVGVELDGSKFMPVTREDDDVGDGVEDVEEGGFFGGVACPGVGLGVVGPEGGEGDGGDYEFERGGSVDFA